MTVNGNTITQATANIATNPNNCPNDGTAPDPVQRGRLRPERHSRHPARPPHLLHGRRTNPFDDYVNNTVTNLTSNPRPPPRRPAARALTATVTSANSQIRQRRHRVLQPDHQPQRQLDVGHPRLQLGRQLVRPGRPRQQLEPTVTCPVTVANNGTGAYSASYSGGNYTSSSQANLAQTNTLTPSVSFGPNSQTNAGGCTSCYYGESSTPDAEGDAFVNGNLSGQLTIGTANNVVINGNLTYADCSGHWVTGQSGEPKSFCPYFSRRHQRLPRPDRQPLRRDQPPGDQCQRNVLPRAGVPPAPCATRPTPAAASPSTPPSWRSPSRSSSTTTAWHAAPQGDEDRSTSTAPSSSTPVARSGPSAATRPCPGT